VDDHNEARRFTQLIDWCYEHHVRLICSLEGSPESILGELSKLTEIGIDAVGGGGFGCADGDVAPSSSGVFQAVARVKETISQRSVGGVGGDGIAAGDTSNGVEAPVSRLDFISADEVLRGQVARVRAHGKDDIQIWRQGDDRTADALGHPRPLPQVSKAWDDRRRISQFTWESSDPTSEQASIKGVFAAAIASLKESGFAVNRAISRLKEMQACAFQEQHRLKHDVKA